MKCNGITTLRIKVSGNTGYANNSTLCLILGKAGLLELPSDEWDLSFLEPSMVQKLDLRIPSGYLWIEVSSCEKQADCIEFVGAGE